MSTSTVTRGYGLLERFLAKKRIKMANILMPPNTRKGQLLDIGCGTHPLFLQETVFAEKYGLDKIVTKDQVRQFQNLGIHLVNHDIEKVEKLPFEDNTFDVVTMLAVFEHIDPEQLAGITLEIHRILRQGGVCILTTPAGWTDGILKCMAMMRLVSPIEIDEHKQKVTHSTITSTLKRGGFREENITLGSFEMFMNLWATAKK